MASWPTIPTWKDPTEINKGNRYNARDGVTAADLNLIITNLMYLKEYSGLSEYSWLGEYVEGVNYRRGAIVRYQGDIYLCVQDLDDQQDPTHEAYWQMLNTVAEWDGTGTVIVPIEPVEPNTFTINGTSYQMETRMTWYEWARSEYNTDGFSCASENDYVYEAESSNKVTDAEGNDVLGTAYIVEGGAYLIKKVVSLITFTIDGEEYQAEDGMNWYQWVQSDYAPDSYSCSSEDSQVNPSSDTYIVDRDNEEVLGRELIISGDSYSIKEFST